MTSGANHHFNTATCSCTWRACMQCTKLSACLLTLSGRLQPPSMHTPPSQAMPQQSSTCPGVVLHPSHRHCPSCARVSLVAIMMDSTIPASHHPLLVLPLMAWPWFFSRIGSNKPPPNGLIVTCRLLSGLSHSSVLAPRVPPPWT